MKKHKKDNQAAVPVTQDRFDLEQQIMSCWGIVDDLTAFVDGDADANELRALATVYQRKFDTLFDTFSNMVAQRQFADPNRQNTQI